MRHYTGISIIDSTSIDACLNQRIAANKVFSSFTQGGKTSTGWFYGFKLHPVIHDRGELLNVDLTLGNVDERKPVLALVKQLFCKLFSDQGYISQPFVELLRQTVEVQMITKRKSNSQNHLPMTLIDRVLLCRRAIVESVIDQLKGISQIEHSATAVCSTSWPI